MISRASAPGKVILFGEHFVVYGVRAILCAIGRRVSVVAETVPERKIVIESGIGRLAADPGANMADVDSPLKPMFYLAKKMTERHGYDGGVSVRVISEIPAGMGLGSSSACCVAGASAVSGLFEKLGRDEILNMAIDAEKTLYPDSSGADCTICMHGGIMEYSGGAFARVDSAPDFDIIIANSGVEHSTSSVVSGVKKFKEADEDRFSEMCDAEEDIVMRALRLIKENDLRGLGACMTENQRLLEEMGVSNEGIRRMIRIADGVSFGSKITGAGGGGCILALGDGPCVQDVICRLNEEDIECFSTEIDFKGLEDVSQD